MNTTTRKVKAPKAIASTRPLSAFDKRHDLHDKAKGTRGRPFLFGWHVFRRGKRAASGLIWGGVCW